MWRNQERDLSILASLVDDLKQYWKWKAQKWTRIQQEIAHARRVKESFSDGEEESEEQALARTLSVDEDYCALRERLALEIAEAKEICSFLSVGRLDALSKVELKDQPLLEDWVLEPLIDEMEWLIPLCKAHSYPLRHCRTAILHPRQWLRDFFSE